MFGELGSIAKLVAGGTVFAGGGVTIAQSLVTEPPKDTVFEVIGEGNFPSFKLECPSKESETTHLSMEKKWDYFKIFCNSSSRSPASRDLKVEGSRGSDTKKDQLSCKYQENNRYVCKYVDQNGTQGEGVKTVIPEELSKNDTVPTKYLIPR
ncbi:hypothetical protein MHLP_02670 [Candidatus Mycoplasma haematolamae str. Purdue]|uniref:Uncharacterized protein n=1 Tax=Mycoplasma haematolamae (strain Purdue) TaxID=1212765 RepID=I7CJS2_MYCHA|nr:hypothetical protein [Candidatus Mycoplasma haematolamae]AFO52114.1 hypothetical protein MHLP_02670 [Candidatus Mycoplasma haematolamae str. Purdue]